MDRATLIERAIPRGMAIATCVWLLAFVARLPAVLLDGPLLLAVLLGALVLGAMLIGWRTGSVALAASSLLVAGLVNCLLVSSAVHSDQPAPSEVARVTLSDWAWIPGNLIASAVIGATLGFAGTLVPGARRQRTESSTRSQATLAGLCIITTLCLIAVGSLVTSMEAGLAVDDWPTSFGYNMFLFPFTKMVAGAFYEHSHRLIGTLVGMQVLTLCFWLWGRRPIAGRSLPLSAGRCPRCGYSIQGLEKRMCPECGEAWTARDERVGRGARFLRRLPMSVQERPVPWLATAVLILVIAQGVLGGLRVTLFNRFGEAGTNVLAVVHACSAQIFLISQALLAIVLWRIARRGSEKDGGPLIANAAAQILGWRVGGALVVLALAQTALGAITRQFHYDWALLLHVLGALAVVLCALTLGSIIIMNSASRRLRLGAGLLIGTVIVQVLLGATTWWLKMRIDPFERPMSAAYTLPASAHVIIGALVLLEAWVLTLMIAGHDPAGDPATAEPSGQPVARGNAARIQRGIA
ncbi:MAG: hypothetical protein IT430_12995 [Phycisphaerales bacterium]|nr:hypothetical protein [Phycisphaerales bacterium]